MRDTEHVDNGHAILGFLAAIFGVLTIAFGLSCDGYKAISEDYHSRLCQELLSNADTTEVLREDNFCVKVLE